MTWPVCGSGRDRAEQLDVGREAVRGEDHPVRFARFRFGQVDRPRNRAGQRRDVEGQVPIFENSGQCASNRVPISAATSGQAILPSAAFGLIVKPSGSVISEVRSSDGGRRFAALRLRDFDRQVEARGGVGAVGRRLRQDAGREAQLLAAGRRRVRRRFAAHFIVVVVFDVRRDRSVRLPQVVGFCRNGFSGMFDFAKVSAALRRRAGTRSGSRSRPRGRSGER